jgi:hypothetical protein
MARGEPHAAAAIPYAASLYDNRPLAQQVIAGLLL